VKPPGLPAIPQAAVLPAVPKAAILPVVVDPEADALRELVRALKRFPSLFALSRDAVALYDRAGTIVAGNDAARALIGGKLRGANYARHVDPAELDRDAARFGRALAGESVTFESVFLTLKGEAIDVDVRLVPALVGGKIIGVFGVARDITKRRRAEASRDESRQEFQSLFEQHPDSITMLDARGRYTRINAAAERFTGYTSQEIAGKNVGIIIPAGGEALDRYALEVIGRGKATRYERTFVRKDGSQGIGEGIAVPIVVDRLVTGLFLMSHDVTDRARIADALALQARRTGALYRLASQVGVGAEDQAAAAIEFGLTELGFESAFVVTLAGETLAIERRIGKKLSVDAGDPVFRQLFLETIAGSALLESDAAALEQRSGAGGAARRFCRSFLGVPLDIRSGRYGAFGLTSRSGTVPLTDFDREFVRALAEFVAISTERGIEERHLQALAHYDALTALPNRLLLSDRFKTALAAAMQREEQVHVYYVDVDRFKSINDTYGHHVGDEVLRAVAGRLLEACRESDTVARLGGDEFIVLRTGPSSAGPEALAARLRAEVEAPCEIDGLGVKFSVGIGISAFPEDGCDEATLLASADTALYAAKASGPGSIRRFEREAPARVELAASLKRRFAPEGGAGPAGAAGPASSQPIH
jgi:diguanylate cyclase (GGDEF)-like protein/PAS domain S-box-containing protein